MEEKMAQNSASSTSRIVLDGSAFAAFFEQKVLKIAHALYMVTSYIPEGEPVRSSLRATALNMVSDLHESDLLGGASVLRGSFQPLFGALLSYLSIAKTTGYISEMNADILTGEINSLKELVSSPETEKENGMLLSKEFFSVPTPLPRIAPREVVRESLTDRTPQIQSQNGFKKDKENGNHALKEKKTKVSRRDKILSLFKDKTTITINDVEKIIEGCSKKTMQRELLSLVEEGILSKEGEKRWSEYRLIENTV